MKQAEGEGEGEEGDVKESKKVRKRSENDKTSCRCGSDTRVIRQEAPLLFFN